jgi:hypothetical protein
MPPGAQATKTVEGSPFWISIRTLLVPGTTRFSHISREHCGHPFSVTNPIALHHLHRATRRRKAVAATMRLVAVVTCPPPSSYIQAVSTMSMVGGKESCTPSWPSPRSGSTGNTSTVR